MKYRIIFSQTVVETATVEVEAADDSEAEEKALDMLDDDVRPDWNWKFTEVESDAEIIAIEPCCSFHAAGGDSTLSCGGDQPLPTPPHIPEKFHP